MNYATIGGRVLAFNYNTIYLSEAERLELHQKFVVDHYLRQFNEETIATKQQHTCGEPCPAVCKKTRDEYKKDYEPYQTMGPLVRDLRPAGRGTAQPPRRSLRVRRRSPWAACWPG